MADPRASSDAGGGGRSQDKLFRSVKACFEDADSSFLRVFKQVQDLGQEMDDFLDQLRKVEVTHFLKEVGSTTNVPENKMIEFFQTHLILACRKKEQDLVNQLLFNMRIHCNNKQPLDRKKFYGQVVHFRKPETEMFAKTALANANENLDVLSCVELIKIEQEIHTKPKYGLDCIKLAVHSGPLLPWIINTYENRYSEPSSIIAFFLVFVELFLLSYLLSGYDFSSDIMLLMEYAELKDYSDDMIHSSIYENMDGSDICDYVYSDDEIKRSFLVAMWMTIGILCVSVLMYMVNVFLASRDKKQRDRISTKQAFLEFVFWPFIHMWRKYKYYSSEEKAMFEKEVDEKDSTWKLVRIVEEGIENVFQMMLSVWLLSYMVPYLATWDLDKLLDKSGKGLSNLLTFGIKKATFLEKFLGKLLMTIVFLTLSITIVKFDKPGVEILHKLKYSLPILIATFLQIICRIIAFLILVEYTVDNDALAVSKYFGFLFVHWLVTFAIVWSFNKKQSGRQSSIRRFLSFVICVLSSNITLQSVPDLSIGKTNEHTFLSQLLFQALVLVENEFLTLLPIMMRDKYPIVECFAYQDFVYYLPAYLLASWLLSNFFQVLHYRWSHPWKSINGPRFDQDNSLCRCSMFAAYCQKEKVQLLSLTMTKHKLLGMQCVKCVCEGEDYDESVIYKQEEQLVTINSKQKEQLPALPPVTQEPTGDGDNAGMSPTLQQAMEEPEEVEEETEFVSEANVEPPPEEVSDERAFPDEDVEKQESEAETQPRTSRAQQQSLDEIEIVDESKDSDNSQRASERWKDHDGDDDSDDVTDARAAKSRAGKGNWQADSQDSERSQKEQQKQAKSKWKA